MFEMQERYSLDPTENLPKHIEQTPKRDVVLVKSVYKEYPLDEVLDYFEVDRNSCRGIVEKIEYIQSYGVHYCDVYSDEKGVMRIFNPENVEFY